jgi:hypothetical protein
MPVTKLLGILIYSGSLFDSTVTTDTRTQHLFAQPQFQDGNRHALIHFMEEFLHSEPVVLEEFKMRSTTFPFLCD